MSGIIWPKPGPRLLKVRVTFKSGEVMLFVIPEEMACVSFVELATSTGGEIRKMEFPE